MVLTLLPHRNEYIMVSRAEVAVVENKTSSVARYGFILPDIAIQVQPACFFNAAFGLVAGCHMDNIDEACLNELTRIEFLK